MARTPKATPKAIDYPLKTKGSKLAEHTRAKANHLTKAEREGHRKEAMALIYGKPQEAARPRH